MKCIQLAIGPFSFLDETSFNTECSQAQVSLSGRRTRRFSYSNLPRMARRRTAAQIHIPSRGSTKTEATISPPDRTSNPRTYTISRDASLAAALSPAWALTTTAIASPSAVPLPITASCRENIGLDALRSREPSLTYDSRCSRDRRSLRTRFTTSILRFRRPVYTGWCPFLRAVLK
jgi:hypothetical protein